MIGEQWEEEHLINLGGSPNQRSTVNHDKPRLWTWFWHDLRPLFSRRVRLWMPQGCHSNQSGDSKWWVSTWDRTGFQVFRESKMIQAFKHLGNMHLFWVFTSWLLQKRFIMVHPPDAPHWLLPAWVDLEPATLKEGWCNQETCDQKQQNNGRGYKIQWLDHRYPSECWEKKWACIQVYIYIITGTTSLKYLFCKETPWLTWTEREAGIPWRRSDSLQRALVIMVPRQKLGNYRWVFGEIPRKYLENWWTSSETPRRNT